MVAQENWQQVKKIFVDTLQQTPEERQQFLDRVCSDDETLRGEVESLLASLDSAESFMETPAVTEVAESVLVGNCHLANGQSLGHYEIIRQLGAGGMGEVYLAEDLKLKRKVALKLLPHIFTSDKNFVRRFEQEALAASSLNHPNIITIYEIGETESGANFIAAEYIKGETLRQHINRAVAGFRL
jgi:serine/threonine protein kinase